MAVRSIAWAGAKSFRSDGIMIAAGLLEMVRASIVGALLANLLVALGLSFLLAVCATTAKSTTRMPSAPTPRRW